MNGPFVIPVRDIVRRPGEMREFRLDLRVPEKWGEGLVSVPESEALELDVRLESVHEGILASGEVSTTFSGVCGRCLRDISEGVEVEFQELFAYSGSEETDFEVQDDHVDLETLVRDAVVLSLPFQPVCQPDCPGLDPVTGVRRAADAEPSAEPIDPRWAALQDYIDHDAVNAPGPRDRDENPAPRAENTEKS
ncbi:YceD family protein [Microbacterium kunmingense]|uniref:YceD family protein n=1 Tax=Microbacterium kunmingense TaxID=2915939 RepID=UPI002004A193|nr:YceD family protein [Microbacterium kunmingense]